MKTALTHEPWMDAYTVKIGPMASIPDDGFFILLGILVAWVRWRLPSLLRR